ncbi:4-amino-4-deoxy-L-arabinose transferase, partial [Lentilactobacillus buchneri]|nr:4-amino-4-deoxy-L-arabinose transferase [Lentilactobacillus buchneri]
GMGGPGATTTTKSTKQAKAPNSNQAPTGAPSGKKKPTGKPGTKPSTKSNPKLKSTQKAGQSNSKSTQKQTTMQGPGGMGSSGVLYDLSSIYK